LVARAELGEQVAHRFLVAQAGKRQAAIGDAVDLGQGDQRLGDAAQFLGLGQGGLDQFVLEQRGGHVLEHRFAVGTGAAELAAGFLVAHDGVSLSVNVGSVCFAVAILALQLGLRWPIRPPWPVVAADLTGPSTLMPVQARGPSNRALADWRPSGRQPSAAHAQPSMPCWATPAGGQFSSFMPSERPRWASTSLISVSDFLPRFGVLSSSTSVFWIRSPM